MAARLTLRERKDIKIRHANLEFRFWQKIDINTVNPDTCWIWIGGSDKDGYGKIKYNSMMCIAHRISWWIYRINYRKGFLQSTLLVCHACDNPSCVNPKHLFEDSHEINMQDMVIKNRQARGHNIHSSVLTENQVLEIRKLYLTKEFFQEELAKKFNVTSGAISAIITKRSWKHI